MRLSPLHAGVAAITFTSAIGSLSAQSSIAGTPRPAFSLFLGGGKSGVAGGSTERATTTFGPLGVAYERAVSPAFAWRGELYVTGTVVGGIPDTVLGGEGTLSRGRTSAGLMVRRYAALDDGRRIYAAIGAALNFAMNCDVDFAGGFY